MLSLGENEWRELADAILKTGSKDVRKTFMALFADEGKAPLGIRGIIELAKKELEDLIRRRVRLGYCLILGFDRAWKEFLDDYLWWYLEDKGFFDQLIDMVWARSMRDVFRTARGR